MQIMAIYWKSVWERSIGDGGRFAGHTAEDLACFDRRMAFLRTRNRLIAV